MIAGRVKLNRVLPDEISRGVVDLCRQEVECRLGRRRKGHLSLKV